MNAASTSPRRRFIFRGNAVAAAGHLTSIHGKPVRLDPGKPTIHGESSLPVIGGISQAQIRKPKLTFGDFIEYGRCGTFAAGIRRGDSATTIVMASVDNVRVTNSPTAEDGVPHIRFVSFVADLLSLGVRSTHPYDGEPEFDLIRTPDTLGMSIVQRLATGKREEIPLRLEFDGEVLDARTFTQFQRLPQRPDTAQRESGGYRPASIVRAIYRGRERREGHVLREPGLGTIYFGEMLLNRDNRRLTLVRIELGSEARGDFASASSDPNGIWE